MTAEEIQEASEQQKTDKGWLREIAYQLALLNEAKKPQESPEPRPKLTHNRIGPTKANDRR